MKILELGLHYPIPLDDLPESWEVGYVGDFASEIQPGFASGKHNQEGTGIPHLRPMNIDRSGKIDLSVVKYVSPDADAKRLREGDVLFNNTNSPELIGKTSVITQSANWGFSNHMTRIAFRDGVDSKYAAYQLHYLWMKGFFLYNCVKHVNQASISSKALARAVPFVVAPYDQQKRIVAEIEKQFSRLDEAVANLKRVKANLKRYKAAVLKAAIEGKLTEQWRKEHPDVEPASHLLERILRERHKSSNSKSPYKQPKGPDTSGLSPLPEGWVWTNLGEVFEISVGATPSRRKQEYWNGRIPWVSSGEVAFCRIRKTRECITELGLENSSTEIHPPGTVLLGMIGEGKTRGQAAILDIAACNNQNSAAIRLSETGIFPEYVYRYLEGQYEQNRSIGSGNNQPALNKARVQSIPIPLAPLSEQGQIVAEIERRMSVIEQLESGVRTNLQRAERLRQSILGFAFSGKLVQQNADAESGAWPDLPLAAEAQGIYKNKK